MNAPEPLDPAADEPASAPSPLERLFREWIGRIEEEGDSAVEDLCRRQPDLASRIRRRVAKLREMGLLSAGSGSGAARSAVPERLGDFRLIERLGGGGMGVVYLAEQESLHREVALKLIRPEHLYFPGARERFRREAEAVARLQHPNIIPIYTVGEADGIPYFAMERVDGCSLADVLVRLHDGDPAALSGTSLMNEVNVVLGAPDPLGERTASATVVRFGRSWVEACFRVAHDVAAALAHAHERGVLHRDVKPGNVMLGRDGRALLVDFGLAALQGSAGITRTGAHVGSAPYMSPEQIRGGESIIDERTDVYSLGVTLYEMLTLRRPFRQAALDDLQRAILHDVPVPPSKRNAGLPWDAETVCLKAMERDRERRYPTVAAFAEDLVNVLELRPIRARRAGPWLRMRRFAQRHPAATLGSVLCILLLVGGPLAYALVQARANAEIQRALDAATIERGKAAAARDRAFETIDRLLLRLGSRDVSDDPEFAELRRESLTDALAVFRGLREELGDDPAVLLAAGDAERRVAEIQHALGQHAEALAGFTAALAAFEPLAAAAPDGAPARAGLAAALAGQAEVLGALGQRETAEPLLQRALELRRAAARVRADDARTQCLLAEAECRLAILLHGIGKQEAAREHARAGADALASAGALRADAGDLALQRVGLHGTVGGLLKQFGELERALGTLRDGIELGEELAREPLPGSKALEAVATLHDNLAKTLSDAHRSQSALAPAERAVLLMRDAVARFPDRPRCRQGLGHALVVRGEIEEDLRQLDRAEQSYSAAIEQFRRLAGDYPGTTSYRANLGAAVGARADALLQAGDLASAEAEFREAVALQETLAVEEPSDYFHQRTLGLNLDGLFEVVYGRREFADALAIAERALAAMERARELAPHRADSGNEVGHALRRLADVELDLADHERVAELAERMRSEFGDPALGATIAAEFFLCDLQMIEALPNLAAAEREALRARYTDRALECLGAARALGYPALDQVLRGGLCDAVRADPRFAALEGKSE